MAKKTFSIYIENINDVGKYSHIVEERQVVKIM